MKTLKFVLPALFALGIIVFMSSFVGNSEPSDSTTATLNKPSDDDVYWFQIIVENDTRKKVYRVKRLSTKIMQGPQSYFEKELWRNMSKGKLPIGPFQFYEEAQDAYALYNTKDSLAHTKLKPNDERPEEIYWYFLKVKSSQRTKAYDFQRTAARVAGGTPEDFINTLREGLEYEQLAIGPFWDYQKAEESKSIYRSNE